MGIEPSEHYNEPLDEPGGDVVPEITRVVAQSLATAVLARIELEAELRMCGVNPERKGIEFTAVHRQVLTAMLSEADSPTSASLRSKAADIAGTLRLDEAVPLLRRMAVDEDEDLQTRLNAVRSYILISGESATRDLKTLLCSKVALVRVEAYITALRSKKELLVAIAEKKFSAEKDPRVKMMVARYIPRLQRSKKTKDDT